MVTFWRDWKARDGTRHYISGQKTIGRSEVTWETIPPKAGVKLPDSPYRTAGHLGLVISPWGWDGQNPLPRCRRGRCSSDRCGPHRRYHRTPWRTPSTRPNRSSYRFPLSPPWQPMTHQELSKSNCLVGHGSFTHLASSRRHFRCAAGLALSPVNLAICNQFSVPPRGPGGEHTGGPARLVSWFTLTAFDPSSIERRESEASVVSGGDLLCGRRQGLAEIPDGRHSTGENRGGDQQ